MIVKEKIDGKTRPEKVDVKWINERMELLKLNEDYLDQRGYYFHGVLDLLGNVEALGETCGLAESNVLNIARRYKRLKKDFDDLLAFANDNLYRVGVLKIDFDAFKMVQGCLIKIMDGKGVEDLEKISSVVKKLAKKNESWKDQLEEERIWIKENDPERIRKMFYECFDCIASCWISHCF